MSWDPKLIPIRKLLAEKYKEEADIRRIIDDAELSSSEIPSDKKATTYWHNILLEAITQNKLLHLIEVCLNDGKNPKLTEAYQNYLNYYKQLASDQIGELLDTPEFSNFYELLIMLQDNLEQGIEPKFILAVIDLVRQMNVVVLGGEKLSEIIAQTISGRLIKSDWQYNEIYQNQKKAFDAVLTEFRDKVIPSNEQHIPIYIIIMAMTDAEAAELDNGNILKPFSEEIQQDFAELKTILQNNGAADWLIRYGKNAMEWKPFGSGENADTIVDIANKELKSLFYDGKNPRLEYIDIRQLNDTDYRQYLKHLRRQDCIVIMDVVSMCHPVLHSQFQETVIDVFDNTFIFSLAPIHAAFEKLRQMSLIIQMKMANMEFSKRIHHKDDEAGICHELHEKNMFEKWLTDRVEKITKFKRQAKPFKPEAKTSVHSFMFEFPQ